MKKCLSMFLVIVFCLCGILLFLACPIDPGTVDTTDDTSDDTTDDTSDDTTDDTAATNRGMLIALGLDLDESDPENYNGEEISEDDNPLGKPITTLGTQYELFQVGATLNAALGRYSVTEQDIDGTLSKLSQYTTTETASWLDLPKKSLAADLDCDGKDEIITAVFNGPDNIISVKYSEPDGVLKTVSLGTFDFMDDFGERTWHHDDYFMRDFTTGDFDNDGYPDFVISCMTGVLILDHRFDIIGSFEMQETVPDNPFVRVEAGDLNGDEYADLVVLYGRLKEDEGISKYYIFEGGSDGLDIPEDASDPTDYAELSGNMSGSSYEYCSGEVAVFDYDGDGLNELIFAGIRDNIGQSDDTFGVYAYLYPGLSLWDPYNETSGNWIMTYPADDYTGFYDINSNGGAHPRNLYVPRLVTGRFDGGDRDMCNVMDLIFYVNDSGEFTIWDEWLYTTWDNYGFHNMAYDLAVAGDLTGNGCDDLVYMVFKDGKLPWANSIGANYQWLNVIDKMVIWGKNEDGAYEILKEIDFESSDEYPALALANVDDDTVVVQYDHYEMIYSAPKILALLGSPPYYEGIMEIGDSETSYSLTSETSTTNTGNIGFYVGASVGFGAEEGTAGATWGASVSASLETSFSWGWGSSYSKGTTLTYSVDAGYDQVIFAGFPIDLYVYKILSAPEEFLEENGSDYLTISIPRTPSTSSVELSVYNSLVSEEYQIPEDLVIHTIGDPFSYYSEAEKEDLEEEGESEGGYLFSEGTLSVTQGYGTTSISTWEETVDISTFDFSLTVGAEVETKLGYVFFSVGAGITGGYSYEYNVGSGTEVGGVVGSIPNVADWSEYNFKWGLMMIPEAFEDQCFNLVTYWVVAE